MSPEAEKKLEEQDALFEKMFAVLTIPSVIIVGYVLIFHVL